MDVRNWKRVLLLWISEFEYTDKSYNNVEQSDVDAFFEHIRQQHKKIAENVKLLDFLQEHYSAYRPHVDDQNELSSADYVYVYSLLLHFTCVKQAEVYFQEKCRKLTNAAQEAIALFFKLMLDCPLQNKENLRHIIGEVAASVNQKLSPKHLSDASSSGTPSPAKTPLSKALSRISPSTPKTMLLDERTRELFNLRAELENERYEKSELEMQIKENELKHNKLNNEYKKLQQQMLDMKNKLVEPENDSTSSSPSEAQEQSQIIRRLKKEIEHKDLEISHLTENVCSLSDKVTYLNKQLNKDKENLKRFKERLHESDCKLYELTQELKKNKTTIQYLNEHKNELEQYINELRSNNTSSRADLNNSSDCLDNSLTRANPTLSPSHAPENMSSVVDMQLREKAREVHQLQHELQELHEMHTTIIDVIKDQAKLLAHNFNVPLSNLMSKDHKDLSAYIQSFVLQLQELNQLYLDDQQNMRTMQEDLRTVGQQNKQQVEQLQQLQQQLNNHKDRIEVLESETIELSQEKLQLEGRLTECVDKITKLLNEQKQALQQFEAVRDQQHKEYANLKINHDKLMQKLAADKQELENYRIKLQECQEQNIKLNQNMEKMSEQLKQNVLSETTMRDKYEKLLIERETLKKQEQSANTHLEKMQGMLSEKEKEMTVLGIEIDEVRGLNTELEQRMEELGNNFNMERQQTNERITKLKDQICNLMQELTEKNTRITEKTAKEKNLKCQINDLMKLCDLSVDDIDDPAEHIAAIINTVADHKQEEQNLMKLMEEKQIDKEEMCANLTAKIKQLSQEYEKQLESNEQLDKELKIVIEKHNEAKVHLNKKEKSFKILHAEFESLEMQYQELQSKLINMDALKADFEEKINKMQSELQKKDEALDSMKSQELDFVSKLNLKTDELENMKLQQKERETELKTYQHQIETLKLDVNEKTQQIVELKKQKSLEIEKLNTKVQNLEKELANNSKNFAMQQKNHESKLKALQINVDDSKLLVKEKQELLTKATVQYEVLEHKFKELQNKQQQTKQQLGEKETEISEMKQVKIKEEFICKELQQKVEILKQDLEEQKALVERTDAALITILATLENAANSVIQFEFGTNEISDIFNISQKEHSQPHLQNLKHCLNKLVVRLTLLEGEVEVKYLELQEKNKQLLELRQSMLGIRQESEEKTLEFANQLINSANKIEKLETEVKDACLKVQELKQHLDLLLQEKQELKETLNDEKTKCKSLEAEVLELTNSRTAMERKLNSVTDLFDKCLDKKQQAESKLSVLEETHKHVVQAHDKLQTQLKENELKLMKLEQEKASIEERSKHVELDKKTSQEKLSVENSKLNKRIEQLALKLGEAQARGNNLEREQKKLIDAHQLALDTLQSEKEKLLNDNNSFKEKIARSETLQDQLATRVNELDAANGKFQQAMLNLQDAKDEIETKLQQIQRQRETQEEKIRQLTADFEQCENNETRWKLEVGALNSQLEVKHELLKKLELERKEQMEKQNAQSQQMEDLIAEVKQLNSTIQDRESKKDEQIEKFEMQMKTLKMEHEQQKQELLLKVEHLNAEKESKVAEYQMQCEEMKELLEKEEKLEEKLQKSILAVELKERELLELRTERDTLEEQRQLLQSQLQDNEKQFTENEVLRNQLGEQLAEKIEICAKLEKHLKDLEKTELTCNEKLSLRLSTCEEMLSKEQEVNAKLRSDNQILQAKYKEKKELLQKNIEQSEERIKENRLELEGKLEKMKNKMKTLYSEEITKIRTKQERDVLAYKHEIESLKAQNNKYEEQSRNLTSQILSLNHNMLENKRQQQFLSTKLKHIQDFEDTQFKQPQCKSVPTSNNLHHTNSAASAISAASSANTYTMEDEEGEVFNNTYLADLKNGRMSELMGKNVGAEELQYRNSLVPPHLKSTYAAQYDHGLDENDMKDSSHVFDDSMSGLLTGGGVRKKISGATHYKRPGPPTPSKHGGRLSLGGNSEPPREILKEYNDNSCSKTPSRFGFFGSRFSIGKDEKNENEEDLRKLVQMRNFELNKDTNSSECKKVKKSRKLLKNKSRAVCTSTPRRNKTHYDQRRALEQSMSDNNNNDEIVIMNKSMEEGNNADTPLTTIVEIKNHRRQSRRLSRFVFANLQISSGGCGSSERRRKSKHFKRTSFYLPGNMFAYTRSPCQAKKRNMNRLKSKDQRRERFNTQREIPSSDSAVEDIEKLITSQDLLTFDKNRLCNKQENGQIEDDWIDIDEGNSAEFQRLLHATQSQAPFEVKKIQFDGISMRNSSQSHSHSSVSTISNVDGINLKVSAATPLSHVTSTGSAQLSRTIYGGSVIYNRRIPNVSSTYVRKSSIYIKNNNASSLGADDIILLTDQTITIADLARMWKQMNNTTRIVICSVLMASLSSIFMLITNFVK